MTFDKMTAYETKEDKMNLDKMTVEKMTVDILFVDEMSWCHI